MPLIDWIKVSELMCYLLVNFVLLYYESVDKLKIYRARLIKKTLLLLIIIWCFNLLLTRVLTIVIDFESHSWPIKMWNYSNLR